MRKTTVIAVILATMLAGCTAGRHSSTMKEAHEPQTKSFTVADNYDEAFKKTVRAVSSMGSEITSQDRRAGNISAKVHNAVILNVTVSKQSDGKTGIDVTGLLMPNKIVTGEFTEVEDFVNAYHRLK